MTIHWKLLQEQPSDGEKRRWRIACRYTEIHGGKCMGYLGHDGDPYKFCQICDRHYSFVDTWGDAR